jgi:hypothetical protein
MLRLKGADITNHINVKQSCQEFSLFQIKIRDYVEIVGE